MKFSDKVYYNGFANPTLEKNLYLGAMNNALDINRNNENELTGSYTATKDLSKGVFSEVYNKNYTKSAHAARVLSAIPLVIWDVLVSTIARLGLFVLESGSNDYQLEKNAGMNFYHIGKNFQIAAGRLYGIVNDEKGMEMVHRAQLDKRIYSIYSASNGGLETSFNQSVNDLLVDHAWSQLKLNKADHERMKSLIEDINPLTDYYKRQIALLKETNVEPKAKVENNRF